MFYVVQGVSVCSALLHADVIKKYTEIATTAAEYIQYDQGKRTFNEIKRLSNDKQQYILLWIFKNWFTQYLLMGT